MPALLASAIVLAFTLSPFFRPSTDGSASTATFPSRIAPYSWWTGTLSASHLGAASMIYQNGVGVEFMDFPQSVVLGADGSSYRRLGAAEELTIAADQGDPAACLLSPDGTFVVVAGADGHGAVRLLTLRDLSQRTLSIGTGRSAIPVSIGADGRSVLLVMSDRRLSPLEDIDFRLHGMLARLDLASGELRTYPTLADVNAAALSPDGSRIVADTATGLVVADSADGRITARLPLPDHVVLDGDAWSPDGSRIAAMDRTSLVIVGLTGTEPAVRTLPLSEIEYGSAIGWRDAETVLVHAGIDGDSNESSFGWVDLGTGSYEPFSNYTPDFTGATLAGADVARDLVATWQIQDRPVGRGPLPLPTAVLLAILTGVLVLLFTPRHSRPGGGGATASEHPAR